MLEYIANFLHILTEAVKLQLLSSTLFFLLSLPVIMFSTNRHPVFAMCLCWLVLLRLIVPIDLVSPTSIQLIFNAIFPPPGFSESATLTDNAVDFYAYEPLTAGNTGTGHNWFLFPLYLLWFVCSLTIFIRLMKQRRILAKSALLATPIQDTHILANVAEWKNRFSIKRPICITSSKSLGFIYTIGTLKPIISIPGYLLESPDTDNLEAAIAHELAHIKRHDDLLIVVTILFKSLFFFFPVVWLCCNYLSNCREKACDQEVLGQKHIKPNVYTRSLLNIVSNSNHSFSDGAVLQLGRNRKSILIERIVFINKDKAMNKTQRSATTFLLILFAIFLLPAATSVASASKTDNNIFSSPVTDGWISSAFGLRNWPAGKNKGKIKLHEGIDIASNEGTEIYATASGIVTKIVDEEANSEQPAFGKYITIVHENGVQSRYMHLHKVNVSVGQHVNKNSIIGLVGKTGLATGPHLHFELLINDEHADPEEYITFNLPRTKPEKSN